jgi:hypothetical protein
MKYFYSDIASVREISGLTPDDISDEEIYRQIRWCSERINDVTGQYFWPEINVFKWSGKGDRTIHSPDLIPIIKVKKLSINYNKTRVDELVGMRKLIYEVWSGVEEIDPKYYEVFERHIEMINGTFPCGSQNIEIDGVLGWIENAKEVETTSTQDLTDGAQSLTVTSAADFDEKDVVDVIGNKSVRFIISKIVDNTLYFEAVKLRQTISSGAKVLTYGRVPELIERALALVVKARAEMMVTGNDLPRSMIQSEKTDSYSYKLFTRGVVYGQLLGSVEAEQILEFFRPPPYVGFV